MPAFCWCGAVASDTARAPVARTSGAKRIALRSVSLTSQSGSRL